MIQLMIILFVAGYLFIALEHTVKINKAGVALLIGTLLWVIYVYVAPTVVLDVSPQLFKDYLQMNPELQKHTFTEQVHNFVVNFQILESIGDIAETVLFLLAAMTIVELIDVHGGFSYITDRITTRNKRRLLWLISLITFFMSSVLDNLTTTIVMVMLIRRIIPDVRSRWLYGSIIVIAANSGGAWSPIGDVTTIMLWVKGNITANNIIPALFLPSFVSMLVPVFITQFFLKGEMKPHPSAEELNDAEEKELLHYFKRKDRLRILIIGISILVLSPVFKSITHLPPFVGLLFGVSLLWIYTDIMYNGKHMQENTKIRVSKILKRLDFSTLLFFIGILLAVDALECSGILGGMATFMSTHVNNIYAQDMIIGLLSAIIDNVPLVAGAIGMYPVTDAAVLSTATNAAFLQNFVVDGIFWHFLAYCAGVGGSILIIGSAAGVVFMGLEGVSFGWYLKRISWMALLGYLAGAAIYVAQVMIF